VWIASVAYQKPIGRGRKLLALSSGSLHGALGIIWSDW